MNCLRTFAGRVQRTAWVLMLPMLVTAGLRAAEIHDAAARGDLNKIRSLLDADAALLESKDADGNTPLHTACNGQPPRIARQVAAAILLLDRGARVNVGNSLGFTPLIFATRNLGEDFDLVQRLVARGADVNAQLDRGMSSLHWVAISGDLKAARFLIDHGANLNANDSAYGTVLHTAINSGRDEEMAKLLVERGAQLNRKFSFGNAELHLAAMKGYAGLVRALVEHGADVHVLNEYNRTPIYYAARFGYRRAADALLAGGAKEQEIVERNYGKATQLAAVLKEGEAYLWYLRGLTGNGYAVKTKGHLLIFDPSGIDASAEAGLVNGRLNPSELAGQNVTVLSTKRAGSASESSLLELTKGIPGASFVTCFQPASGPEGGVAPRHHFAAPNASFRFGDLQVHAIPATGSTAAGVDAGGVGYLVEADGVKIFHAGFHSSRNQAEQLERYRKEIDFLKPFGPIDVAILPVSGHISVDYQPYLYLLDRLSPKAVYLMGGDIATSEYPKCAEVLRARNIPVAYPEGGIARGERFHYLRSQARGAQFPAVRAASEAPQRALDVTYIANEGFLVRAAGKKVLIDAPIVVPAIAPPPETLKAITEGREPFNDLDLILITHSHADHFHPASLIACLRINPKARLVAPTQVIDLLRPVDGFADIEKQIREIKEEAGAREQVSHNGIAFDVLCLNHEHRPQVRNLAFAVDLGGTRFLHLGDAFIDENEAHLNSYSFEQAPIDLVFLNQYDRSQVTRQFLGRKIKPSRIVVMHIPPAEIAVELKKVWAAYPFAIVFRKSMEQRALPIEVDFHNLSGDYFGQQPPGAMPQVFASGIVSSDLQEHGAPAFSPDGNEVVWYSNRRPGPDNEQWINVVMTMRRESGRWSAPYVPAPDIHGLSTDGRRAFFTVPPAPGGPSVPDIWFVEKQGDGWSEPKSLNLIARYPELRFAMGSSVARNGNLYFLAYTPGPLNDYGIYRSELVNGEYAKPELLPRGINLPPFLNWTLFIASDESYLLFSSNRRDPDHDAGDIYISRRLADGSWADPVSLGEPVNTNRQERFPVISNDGKYLFFSRQTPDHDEDVFWVDAATVPALRSAAGPPRENPK